MILIEKRIRYISLNIKWNIFIKVDFSFKIINCEIKLFWKNISNKILWFNNNDNLNILVLIYFYKLRNNK